MFARLQDLGRALAIIISLLTHRFDFSNVGERVADVR
jgi:hypothetical protein